MCAPDGPDAHSQLAGDLERRQTLGAEFRPLWSRWNTAPGWPWLSGGARVFLSVLYVLIWLVLRAFRQGSARGSRRHLQAQPQVIARRVGEVLAHAQVALRGLD